MKAAAGWRDHVHGYGFEVLLKPTLTLKADAKLRSAHKIHNLRRNTACDIDATSGIKRAAREAKAEHDARHGFRQACPFGRLNNSKISSSVRDSSHPLLAAFRIRALLLQESAR
jgi:hypothetical protein